MDCNPEVAVDRKSVKKCRGCLYYLNYMRLFKFLNSKYPEIRDSFFQVRLAEEIDYEEKI